jgi:lysophospholipase L1-like esterase
VNIFSLFILLLLSAGNFGDTFSQKLDVNGLTTYTPVKLMGIDSSYLDKYPMVNFEKNYFQFYSEESPNWTALYNKMESLVATYKGKLNFYHIGGSHLQADIYSHDIRTYFQSSWSKLSGERGWVFPFALAGSNNPWNYRFYSPNTWKGYRCSVRSHLYQEFGLAGSKIVSSDSLINIVFEYKQTDVKPPFNRIRIYHNTGNFPYEFNWGKDELFWWKQERNHDLGYTDVFFSEPLSNFDLEIRKTISGHNELEIFGFQLLNDLPGISYNSIGVNGAGLYSYLDCKRLESELKSSPPDFFAFSVGTNDANVPNDAFDPEIYKQNLEKMMQIVLRANPQCAILLTVPNDSYYKRKYLNKNIAQQRRVIQELAQQYQVPVWDFYGIMGELGSSSTWHVAGLMKSDYVHFTAAGYHLKGDLFIDAFRKYLYQFGKRKVYNLINGYGKN